MRLEVGTIPTFKWLEVGTLSKVTSFFLTLKLTLILKQGPETKIRRPKDAEKNCLKYRQMRPNE